MRHRRKSIAIVCLVGLGFPALYSLAQPGADALSGGAKFLENKDLQKKLLKSLADSIPPTPETPNFKITVGVPDRVTEYANRYANNRSRRDRSPLSGLDGIRFARNELSEFTTGAGLVQPGPETVVIADGSSHPALKFCTQGSIDPVPPQWGDDFTQNADKIEKVLLRTGFITTDQAHMPALGTCFLIAPKIVLTNRHVATEFTNDDLSFKASLTPDANGPMIVSATFTRYVCSMPIVKFKVAKVLYIASEQSLDFALLRLDDPQNLLPADPLKLAGAQPASLASRKVFVCGNPLFDNDGTIPQDVMSAIFGVPLGVKRISPGFLMAESSANSLTHDCSTLGGSSGSPVVDFETGEVIGLHWAGNYDTFDKRNFAVPSWRISQVPKVIEILHP